MSSRRIAIVAIAGLCMIGGLLLLVWANHRQPLPSAPMSVTHSPTPSALPAGYIALDAHRSLGPSHSYRNLTLIPVYDSQAKATDTYTTLDEGLQGKTVKVQESTDGGDVNTLYVTNTGSKPLYLMAGEVVLGGQQDRCMGKDRIIPPGKKRVPVSVYCVEHNRWVGRAEFDSSAKSVASAEIRLQAQEGAFEAERALAARPVPNSVGGRSVAGGSEIVAGAMPASGGAAALDNGIVEVTSNSPVAISSDENVAKAQQQVWAKVAEKNAHMKTETGTGTYRNTLNMTAGDAQTAVPAYVKALSGSLDNDPHLVGVIAAVNGKIIAVDIFSEPILFRKLFPKLLGAYAADAFENSLDVNPKASAVTLDQAKIFYLQATDGHAKAENKSEASSTLRLDSTEATVYRLVPNAEPQAAHGAHVAGTTAAKPVDAGGEVEGKAIHETVLHK
ncbi:MAG TPA: DUF6569 family protein [Chthonomonadaceae bacterium]|nr:DUF6569 family protein [Chthonomonadaceae bacterium]